MKPYLWSQIGDFWTLRSQAELISDPGFNNIDNRADWNRISNNPQSYASITRSDNNSNLMILAEEYKEYNEEEKKFETETLKPAKSFIYDLILKNCFGIFQAILTQSIIISNKIILQIKIYFLRILQMSAKS